MRPAARSRCAAAVFLALSLLGEEARAQCKATGAQSVMSEARRARWLIGDDARFQAQLDDERQHFTSTMKTLEADDREFQVYGATAFSFQTVWPFDVCTNQGGAEASFERMRAAASAGLTHAETGLHARVSVVGALDQLNVSTSDDEDATNARSGAHQLLVAARFGHERYLRLILGYVGADKTFAQTGTNDVTLVRDRALPPAPGTFIGASIPIVHTSVITLIQDGRTELFSVLAHDLRPGRLPFSLSLGPTYIREERQTVGLVRFRPISHERVELDKDDIDFNEGKAHYGASLERVTIGPVLELSAESRDARVRHGRFRVQADAFEAFGGATRQRIVHASIYGEGTFFRSRFFSESFASPTEPPRGTAWGLGTGLRAGLAIAPVSVTLDGHANFNRPELLSLLPSTADRPEVRFGISARIEN